MIFILGTLIILNEFTEKVEREQKLFTAHRKRGGGFLNYYLLNEKSKEWHV